MKNRIFLMTAVFFLASFSLVAQNNAEKFKVFGNCGMCESRIEKAAESVDGVSEADWDKETKMMAVSFDKSETGMDKIHKAIADVGHDTKKVKADSETYNGLPGCCKYDRAKTGKDEKGHEGHDHH